MLAAVLWLLFPRPSVEAPTPVVSHDRLERPAPHVVEPGPDADELQEPPEPATPEPVAPETIGVTGRVLGGGRHQVAGCPRGDVFETDDQGQFSLRVPLDQSCALRVARSDQTGMYLGDPVDISAAHDVEVELAPPQHPLSQEEVDLALLRLRQIATQDLIRLEQELSMSTDPNLHMELQSELDAAHHRRQRLADPEQAMLVVEDWVFGVMD